MSSNDSPAAAAAERGAKREARRSTKKPNGKGKGGGGGEGKGGKTKRDNKRSARLAVGSSSWPGGGGRSIASRIRAVENLALSRFYDAARTVQFTSRITRDAISDGASTSDTGSSDDEAGATDVKTLTAQGELPQDFWQIQKLVRYLKIGNQGGEMRVRMAASSLAAIWGGSGESGRNAGMF